MLEQLTVGGYALIDRISVEFKSGLNILTGETGAGKSILIGALGLLLGQKADTSVIRSGREETLVTGTVRVSDNPEVLQWLKQRGIQPEDGTIILRRMVRKSGRGSILVGAQPVTRPELAELTSLIFDIHGQHEHQSLLKAENHLHLLDHFGHCKLEAAKASDLYQKLASVQAKLNKTDREERQRLREIDLLRYAISEIEKASLKANEEEQLAAEHKLLANHEKMARLLAEIYSEVAESQGGGLASLRLSRQALEEIIQIDPSLVASSRQLENAFYELEDFAESIRAYQSAFEFDPGRLADTEDRLNTIRELKRKYGDTIAEVLEYSEKAKVELEELENWEDQKSQWEQQAGNLTAELKEVALALTSKRGEAAEGLQSQIENELATLGMGKVKFKVLMKPRKDKKGELSIGPTGSDLVEFVISTNPGEPYRRLRSIASGGELSRVMLAIKSILADSDNINALIFDEIDAGIGGEIAVVLGQRLHQLARVKQILCITHLATIAVQADHHLEVEKFTEGNRTFVKTLELEGRRKRQEISRMLSGDSGDEVALRHAEELIKKYETGVKRR